MGFHPHQPLNNIDIRSQADFERDAEKEKLSKGVSSAPSHGRKGCDKAKQNVLRNGQEDRLMQPVSMIVTKSMFKARIKICVVNV